MEETNLLYTVAGALLTASLLGLWSWAKKLFFRLQTTAPERRKADRLEVRLAHHGKVLDALLVTQGPTLDGVIALLEAAKGQCNGNVDRALNRAVGARQEFNDFLVDSSKAVP